MFGQDSFGVCNRNIMLKNTILYVNVQSSEIRGLGSKKYSSKILQHLLYFMYKKTQVVFFFHF